MAANALASTYDNLRSEVSLALGWNLTLASWNSHNTAQFAIINKYALQQAYYPEPLPGERTGHVWSWMRPKGVLTLNAPYSTGTVTIVADGAGAIVTLASGTWPSWAAAGDLWVDGERYAVLSRTSNSVIRLVSTTASEAAGTTYKLIQHEYDLPADFGGMNSDGFKIRRDQQDCGFIPLWTPGDAEGVDSVYTTTGVPTRAAVVPVAATATADTTWQAVFYGPLPKDDLRLEFRYKAIPPVLDGSTHVYHYGGAMASRMVTASYLDAAYQKVRDSFEMHDAFLAAQRQAIMYDRQANAPHTFGRGQRSIGSRTPDAMEYVNARRAQESYTMDDLV
jgi:hypothetical protein